MIELSSKTPKKQLDSYLAQTVQELMNCNRCILVTGAGISCSAGIPVSDLLLQILSFIC
jgi:hypothetical protein